jgi:hypothetical protein
LIDRAKNQAVRVYSVAQDLLGAVAVQDDLWVVLRGEDAVWRIRP